MKKEYYNNLNGIRTIAAICIIIMHVAKNANYDITGFFYTNIICRFESFVTMFFVLSAFSMCCGYYDKIKNNKINLNDFYKKRYIRIWPFFAMLVGLELIFSFSGKNTIFEAFSDLTLLFGFLPCSSIEVVGVGWTLGVIFAFYCLFPFFVFLLWNRKRAWFSLVISLGIQYLCQFYFLNNENRVLCNVMAWWCYFIIGGILFLYKDKIKDIVKNNRILFLVCSIVLTFLWIITEEKIVNFYIYTIKTIIVDCAWIMYAISINSKILSNRVTEFIGGISFEIYLSHMAFYRFIEKLNLTYIGNIDIISYIISCFLVIICSVIFSTLIKRIMNYIEVKRKRVT